LGRPRLAELLVRLGIGTLGGFAALPPDRVAARFGSDGTAAHRTASGREPHLLDASGAEPDHAVRRVFAPHGRRWRRGGTATARGGPRGCRSPPPTAAPG
ncbi:hypothetical protein AB0922_33545, partial [Actinacidiphila alni]